MQGVPRAGILIRVLDGLKLTLDQLFFVLYTLLFCEFNKKANLGNEYISKKGSLLSTHFLG
jgi:hypothetical protein